MAKIVLASHNQGKLRELREILRGRIDGLNVETDVVDASAVHAPDVPETGVSFAENSLIKARAIAEATGLIAVADDSGLSVDVLGGAPGIFSARWSGVHGDDTANLNLLLHQLSDIADEHRAAKFCCAASLAVPEADGGYEAVEYGELPGVLLLAHLPHSYHTLKKPSRTRPSSLVHCPQRGNILPAPIISATLWFSCEMGRKGAQ